MTLQETINHLHTFQKWRRGAVIPMPDPKHIGTAIDNAIRELRKLKKQNNGKD